MADLHDLPAHPARFARRFAHPLLPTPCNPE